MSKIVTRTYSDFVEYVHHVESIANQSAGAPGIGNAMRKIVEALHGYITKWQDKVQQETGSRPPWEKIADVFPKPYILKYDKDNFIETIGSGFQQLGEQVKEGVKNLGQFVSDAIKKIGSIAAILPLAPFKKAMKKALKNRHIDHGNDILDIANKFFREVLHKNFEHIEPVTISLIVMAIIKFFKDMKDKQNKSPEEAELTDIAEKDAANADALINEEYQNLQNRDSGGTVGTNKTGAMLPILLALGLIYYFALRKR